MKRVVKALFVVVLMVLFAGAANAQIDFTGTWVLKQVVTDPDSMVKPENSRDMVITKVTDDYFRAAMGDNSLLYKRIKENTLYSNFSPDREITIVYKPDSTIEITATVTKDSQNHDHDHVDGEEHDHDHGDEGKHRPVTMIWERKKEK